MTEEVKTFVKVVLECKLTAERRIDYVNARTNKKCLKDNNLSESEADSYLREIGSLRGKIEAYGYILKLLIGVKMITKEEIKELDDEVRRGLK